jgi:hypothetical protein
LSEWTPVGVSFLCSRAWCSWRPPLRRRPTRDRGRDRTQGLAQVSQREQTIFGEGGFPALSCDGVAHLYEVRAFSFDQPFRRGIAQASVFILACDETGANCEQGPAVGRIVIT